VFCLVVWAGSVALLWAGEEHLVFMTGNSRAYTQPLDPSLFKPRILSYSGARRLSAVMLTHDDDADRYWILFCVPAGASTQVDRIQGQLKRLWSLGYDVFAFDYRGFGDSSGTPTEDGVYEDAAAAYAYLSRIERVPPSRIILAGRSLGSAVAVELATRVDSAGLLLFSPIDSVPSVAQRLYPWAPVRWLARHRFDSASKARTIDVPVVMFYGWPDSYVRRSDARALLAEFRGPKLLIETGGGHHFAGFADRGELYRNLKRFWPAQPQSQ
jgi:fermentation-respiration switch protein FrsA (DUF1100 family)